MRVEDEESRIYLFLLLGSRSDEDSLGRCMLWPQAAEYNMATKNKNGTIVIRHISHIIKIDYRPTAGPIW